MPSYYTVKNKSRQGIPVMVVEGGNTVQKDLSYHGVSSTCKSEELTVSMKALERLGVVKITK